MKPPGDDDARAPAVPAAADGSPGRGGVREVIEMGQRRTLWPGNGNKRAMAGAAVAALVTGLLLGYLGGHLGARAKGAPARLEGAATAAPQAGSPVLASTGNRCAVQRGQTLQLGIEIVNQSRSVVTVRRFWPVLPLGGLRAAAIGWGTCGALPVPGAVATTSLDAGATGWLTTTFDVLVRCPRPLPVQFRVSYMQSGRAATVEFDSFPDLGQIQYTECPVNH